MSKYTIGIDEAGRGPLAGPVSVGVACVPNDFNWESIPGVNDSKKLSEKKREVIYEIVEELKKEGKLDYTVAMVDAATIDDIGIVPSIQKAMQEALEQIISPNPRAALGLKECRVLLDGGLHAPEKFVNQETIIGGDGKEKIIGLASIMAKVTRDRHMVELSKDRPYSLYQFELHKGYGTAKHQSAIREFGLCTIHRKTYCTKLLNE